ncbi:MAG: heavy-metal-associated domain-containing protein [Acidobacteria bacterium]|nr:heavy-metal-associated domain-containing protein [Acidobacteriota bacterium]
MESATRNRPRLAGAALGAVLLFGAVSTSAGVTAPQSPDLPGMVRVTIAVELSCPSCAAGLERRLRRLDYVAGVEVSPSGGQIVLAVEPGRHPDPAAVWDTVRNAGFIPDRMAVAAIGHVTDRNGTPALALSPDFALPLVEMDGLTATVTSAGVRLVTVTGHWHASPDGAGRLQVESLEVRQ